MFELRDYQKDCLEATVSARKSGTNKQMIVLSVGAGKTVIAASLGKYHDDVFPMLFLAHREELLHQAKDKIEAINPELTVEIEQGAIQADTNADVVCASVASIGRSNSTRINKFEKDYFKSIVVDEAHHSAADTYKNVLNYFEGYFLLGITATPKRADNVRLDDVYDKIVYEKNMLELIGEGYLSNPISYRFSSDVDISGVTLRAGDYAIGELSEAINVEARHEVAVKGYEQIREEMGKDPKAIVFCVDVKHAQDLAKYFTSRGYPANFVSGDSEGREEIVADHKAGKFKVLTNCQVAVEGYDDPSINLVIMARPTRSSVFYIQAIGRGARLDGQENLFYVLDIADSSRGKRPLSILSLHGLPADFEAEGVELTEVISEFEKLKDTSPSQAATVKSLDDIGAAWEKIDLFTPPEPNPILLQYSSLLWMEVGNDYIINVNPEHKVSIRPNQLGVFEVFLNAGKIGSDGELAEAFAFADKEIKSSFSDDINLIDQESPWRKDPPTDKQVKILKKNQIPYEHLTKGQASEIISKIFAESPKKERPAWLQRKIDASKTNKGFKF